MKKRIIQTVCIALVLALSFGFGGRQILVFALADGSTDNLQAFEPTKRDVRRLMLGKYYISSEEDPEQELLWDFENRLYALCIESGYEPDGEELEVRKNELFDKCCQEADTLCITPEEWARQKYLLTVQTESLGVNKDLSPDYFEIFATADLRIEKAVDYLVSLWNLTADEELVEKLVSEGATAEEAEKQALKSAVMNYSLEHSKIVSRPKSVKLFKVRLKLAYGWRTNEQMLRPEYVVGEDGYAALYNREYFLSADWLEPFLGDLVAGEASCDAIYRFLGAEDWNWLIVRRNGEYALCNFVKWVEKDSFEYDDYISIYGFEPKIHP